MPEPAFLPPLPKGPLMPFAERRGRDFTAEEYDQALGAVNERLMPLAFAGGLSALAGPESLSLANVIMSLVGSQLPENQSVLLAGATKQPAAAMGKALGRLVSPARRGANLEGFMAGPGGQVIDLEEAARHFNLASTQGTSIPKMLQRGFVRGRGNGVEVHSLQAADPDALRLALRRAARNSPEVYVDTPGASLVYDAAELAEAGFELGRVRPIQRFVKENPW